MNGDASVKLLMTQGQCYPYSEVNETWQFRLTWKL